MDRLSLKLKIKKHDKQNLYQSTIDLHKQCRHAFTDANKLLIPKNYLNTDHLIISGMGGSGLGARAIQSIYSQNLKLPLTQIHDYNLPSWVNQNTLVICSSYSGNTEETISTCNQAVKRQAKTIIITTGGKLLNLAKKHHLPFYQIDPKFNLCNQPRLAIGYSLIGQIVIASKLNLIKFTSVDLKQLTQAMTKVVKYNSVNIKHKNSPAKQLAKKLKDKQAILIAAQHLTGPFHTIKNQMNENAKHLSQRHDLPELNHHLMEGLRFPTTNKKNLLVWLVDSHLYSNSIRKRLQLTKQVIEKNNLTTYTYQPTASTRISQAFELIQFGSLTNFYLSMNHSIDPSPIPWVDYFKKHL